MDARAVMFDPFILVLLVLVILTVMAVKAKEDDF